MDLLLVFFIIISHKLIKYCHRPNLVFEGKMVKVMILCRYLLLPSWSGGWEDSLRSADVVLVP